MNTLWTYPKITALQQRAKEAQGNIADLFVKRAVKLDNGFVAWGQFIDDPIDKQVGIYGTSAAIQVLTPDHFTIDYDLVKGGISYLHNELHLDKQTDNSQKSDIHLTYKLSAILEALHPGLNTIEGDSSELDTLIDQVLPDQGWGNYYFSESDRDNISRVAATSYALIALWRYRKFRADKRGESALNWLIKFIPKNASLSIPELALAAITLRDLKKIGIAVETADYDTAIQYCQKKLVNWAVSGGKNRLGTKAFYPYSFGDTRGNRYLFFLSDCLAASALLSLGNPLRSRQFVLNVCEFYAEKVITSKGFADQENPRPAAVDHLWIHRLLSEIRKQNVGVLAPSGFLGAPVSVKIIIGLICLGFGIWGMFLADAKISWAHYAGLFASTIFLGLLVELIAPIVKGESS